MGRRSGKGTRALAHARAAQESAPLGLDLQPHPGLLCPPARSPPRPPDPHLLQRDLQPLRPWSPKEGGGLGAGPCRAAAGGPVPAETPASGGGSLPHPPNGVGAREGAGLGRKRAGAVFVAAPPPSGTDGGEGRGYVAGGGGGVRGPADEEPRISDAPSLPGEAPLPISSRKEGGRGGAAPGFLSGGPRPLAWPGPCRAPGSLSSSCPPQNRRWPGRGSGPPGAARAVRVNGAARRGAAELGACSGILRSCRKEC